MRISDWSSDVCSSDLVERAYLVGRQTMPEAPIFPIPDERLNDVLRRSYYLSSLYHNNAISSARSAYFAGNEKRKDIERPWYGIARGRQGCVETISPAQQIKIIRYDGVEPRIRKKQSGRETGREEVWKEG